MSGNPNRFIHNNNVVIVVENIHANNGSNRNFRIWDGDFEEVVFAELERFRGGIPIDSNMSFKDQVTASRA